MADQWNITLGARYTYDTKGMTYITSSNAIGVPGNLITPCCQSALQPGCSSYSAGSATANYSDTQKAGQKAVVDGTIAAMPALVSSISALADIDASQSEIVAVDSIIGTLSNNVSTS